ncbi:nuclease domain-containing protein [Stenotrophomonas maltophilia]|uniref:DUF1364 family protein n=1 Tax=Stenotrophomonas maltophilia TaxID=40324 RepID=A0AAJ2JCL6_STEMA|nr:nuclease domain-containing protein [Stenotrophomonas maltophilia]MDT3468647.1 DUF1364 family protein [Stenotrophomonas maltophilia]
MIVAGTERTARGSNYRDRSLLDLAYQLNCTLQIDGVCEGGPGEPCHSNQSRHGKGGSIKAHDCFFASGCRSCHRELDQGKRFTREKKAEIWQRAHDLTMLQLWQQGYLQVRA